MPITRLARVEIEGVSTYSQSKMYTPAPQRKQASEYEKETWRERCHVNDEGFIFIPPMAFKNALWEAARYLQIKVPGMRGKTYIDFFVRGLLVMDPIVLPTKKADVEGEWLFVPSDGRRGGGSRVQKCFPIIKQWGGELKVYVLDERITPEVFKEHIVAAGQFVGIGRFRPERGGFNGRFRVRKIAWEELALEVDEAA